MAYNAVRREHAGRRSATKTNSKRRTAFRAVTPWYAISSKKREELNDVLPPQTQSLVTESVATLPPWPKD